MNLPSPDISRNPSRCERRSTRRLLAAAVVLAGTLGCSKNPTEVPPPPIISGTVIRGTVRLSETDAPLPYSRVALEGGVVRVVALTDANGSFAYGGVVPATYTVTLERAGFDTIAVGVPAGVSDTSRLTIDAVRSSMAPAVKPFGKGIYRVNGRVLEEDPDRDGWYAPFRVKGVAHSPSAIGKQGEFSTAGLSRSFLYLDTLHANTIRTYNGASSELLTMAAAHGVRVIVGFWVSTTANMADPAFREQTVRSFRDMVNAFKDYPAVLCWNLGNEQNLSFVNGNNPHWYDLAQEMAVAAYLVEGENYHPVCINNGEFANIGDAAKRADDASLTYIDLWASNIYKLNLTSSFASYRTQTTKPIVVTEFGIDALDNRTRIEYEGMQALVDSLNWDQISAASDVCVGACVFEYTDEWWKAGDPWSHDPGGYATSAHPDGYSNEEWWGLVAVTPDANGDGLDEWRPRAAYRMFQRVWQ